MCNLFTAPTDDKANQDDVVWETEKIAGQTNPSIDSIDSNAGISIRSILV